MNKHTTSLELSKKLKELGVKQESEFYYIGDILLNEDAENIAREYGEFYEGEKVSAYLSSELGGMFDFHVDFGINSLINHSKNCAVCGGIEEPRYYCSYYSREHDVEFNADTEADARAKMLIYLLVNKLI